VYFLIFIELFPYCLFVSNSQVIGCKDRLQNDLYCVGWWGVKLYSILFNTCRKNNHCLWYKFQCVWIMKLVIFV